MANRVEVEALDPGDLLGTRRPHPDIDPEMEYATGLRQVGLDDDTLWEGVRRGDADALAVLFRLHADAIYNYCFRRLGDWSAAEDMVSLVFLEAWRRRDAEVIPGKVLAWLYGIATNVVRNRRRSERRYAAALRRLPAERPTSDFADDAVLRADDERQMKLLLDQVSRLPRHEQDVLALCVWSELGYDDAAVALGVPVGTVRSRLSRARAHLQEPDAAPGHRRGAQGLVKEVPEE